MRPVFRTRGHPLAHAVVGGVAALMMMVSTATAQTVVKPGFNIFSVEQDVEIGRQSAAQVDRQIPAVSDAAINRYVQALGARLAAQAPGARYPYRFRVVNLAEVNAFALPGGFVYVHRGLLEQVRSEGELAGVMAHEIAHIALRHPTNQASKAYMTQAGLGILGGLLGGDRSSSSTGQVIGALGGFGLNTLFLKFSRSAETQADIVGAQIMDRAGYDPMEMAHFFNYLSRQAGGNPGRFAVFLSNHPAPSNREARVQQEARLLGRPASTAQIGDLAMVQSRSRRLPRAPTMAQLAQGQAAGAASLPAGTAGLSIERPSSTFRTVQQPRGLFQVQRPDNWSAYTSSRDHGVTIVPRGGSSGNRITHGVIINHYVPFDGSVGSSYPSSPTYGSGALASATEDLVRQLQNSNSYLDPIRGSQRRASIAGRSAMVVTMAGRSPGTGEEERIDVVTQQLADGHIVYVLLIAPRDEYSVLAPTFQRIVGSLRTDTRSSHG
ncbi:MAG TPA: M48 family metallopeptidase [Candidatus Eisenbacteria bacterium]|nr:M48 family metallopeptidase [Candidatus Eisenbacteria bacterium]